VIRNDNEWQEFGDVVEQEWATSDRFATFSSRKQNEKELNKLIASWTIQYAPGALMDLLQKQGIPAGVVQNAKDLIEDKQLSHRNALWRLEHQEIGSHFAFGQGFIFSRTPPPTPRSAPRLGEHVFHICKEILGMPDEEIGRLIGEGVLYIET
jgi:crotonobetainyl-CoA:carnitine CoA-transferase CaiB-like acyl-CoA transferase